VNDHDGTRLVVYGYIHQPQPDAIELAADCKEIAHYCAVRGYQLVTIFCDRQADDAALLRPGFFGLLDALSLPDSYGVVVVDRATLSSQPAVRDAMVGLVDCVAATVIDMTRGCA
jgi:hypothetical protein